MSVSYHLSIREHLLNSLVPSPKEASSLSLVRSVITNRSKIIQTKIVTSRQSPKIWKQTETSTRNESILIITIGRRCKNRIIWHSFKNNTGSFLCFLNNSNSHLQEYIRKSIFPFFHQVMALTCTAPGPDSSLYYFSFISGTSFTVLQQHGLWALSVCLKKKMIGWTFEGLMA